MREISRLAQESARNAPIRETKNRTGGKTIEPIHRYLFAPMLFIHLAVNSILITMIDKSRIIISVHNNDDNQPQQLR